LPQRRNKSARTRKKPDKKVKAARAKARNAQIVVSPRDRAAGEWFAKLLALQERLLAPDGCPWDREQTHESLRKYLVEETYEVLDAMESGDPRKFSSELGDLLLQIVFHSALAQQERNFAISDVIEAVYTKMIRRHPHVFGEVAAKNSAAVLKKWEEIKAEERAEEARSRSGATTEEFAHEEQAAASILDGVSPSLPAVLEAYQLTRRASHVGFDWEDLAGIFDKLDEERRELTSLRPTVAPANQRGPGAATPEDMHRVEEEVGDLMFVCVNIARFLGVDPEIALKKANAKFKRRFQWMESAAARAGRRFADLPRAQKEALWDQSKGQA
jgi:MazG family protein